MKPSSSFQKDAFLREMLWYMNNPDIHCIHREIELGFLKAALDIAIESHGKEKPRRDGSPYIEHPIAVARLYVHHESSRNSFDIAGIISAVLHDVSENHSKEWPLQAIRSYLLKKNAHLLYGVNNSHPEDYLDELIEWIGILTKDAPMHDLVPEDDASAWAVAFEAEFRRIMYVNRFNQILPHSDILKRGFLECSKEERFAIRVILVKLYDRLHNLQTSFTESLDRKKKIATTTQNEFLRLSDRMGDPIKTLIRNELGKLEKTILEEASGKLQTPREHTRWRTKKLLGEW